MVRTVEIQGSAVAPPERGEVQGAESIPCWASRLQELARALEDEADQARREVLLTQAWLILHSVTFRFLRRHASGNARVTPDDLEEIAEKRVSDLLCRMRSSEWVMTRRPPNEVAPYLSRVARNGLATFLGRRHRRITTIAGGAQNAIGIEGKAMQAAGEGPEAGVERREFARALRECAEKLDPRVRLIWYLRVFCGLSSRQIAAHPEVQLKPSHIDVLLMRGRRAIKAAMRARGYSPADMPAGCFVEIWRAFRLEEPDRP